ncbi:hypothetical protein ISN76_13215 [Dyella halodurans]|uniref:Uncharacterized protein n=1 Tax=Dyella halodurans TaxID=1920171 RepID=A0ABV9BZI2_9GAMM|nr:hypothetical protein [Dyella halodurans]
MSDKNIPSKEDFARAKAAMGKNDQGLSEVRAQVLMRVKSKGLHELFVLYSPRSRTFGVYVFYRWDREIDEAAKSGLAEEIRSAVFDELEKAGRGDKGSIQVDFEFDSHESVERDYEGNYFNRLH